jgi:ABC-type branched-subunit amino acid transport system ATPase component
MAEASALLQVRGLTRRFGGLLAVSGLDLEVHAGEILGLIGPNGAGKKHHLRHDRWGH